MGTVLESQSIVLTIVSLDCIPRSFDQDLTKQLKS